MDDNSSHLKIDCSKKINRHAKCEISNLEQRDLVGNEFFSLEEKFARDMRHENSKKSSEGNVKTNFSPKEKNSHETCNNGHLVIVDKTGKPWFQGGSSTKSLLTEPHIDDGSLEKTVPPNIINTLNTSTKVPRKPPKMRALAKYSAPPTHPIFKKISDGLTDPFWKDIFLRMSKNIYRKGIRYNSNPPPLEGGKLIYRSKNKEFILELNTNPDDILKNVRIFMEKHIGISSDIDQTLLNKILKEERKNPLEYLPKLWSHVKGYNSKSTLITHYAGMVKTRLRLNDKQYDNLISTISIGIASGILGDGSICLNNGAIENIIGLMQDTETQEFYFDINETEGAENKFISYISHIKSIAKNEEESSTSKITGPKTTNYNLNRSRTSRNSVMFMKKSENDRIGQKTFLYETASSATYNLEYSDVRSTNKELKTIPPSTIFNRSVEKAETNLFQKIFNNYSNNKNESVSKSLPSDDELNKFISDYPQNIIDMVLTSIISGAFGFVEAVSLPNTTSNSEKLEIAMINSVNTVNIIKSDKKYISQGVQKMIDQTMMTNFKDLFKEDETANVLIFNSSSDVSSESRHRILNEIVKEKFKKYENLLKEDLKESKYLKRAETLAYSTADKIFRIRNSCIEYQISESKNIEIFSYPLSESVSTVGKGTINKPKASIKRWNKFVETLEKKLTERSIKNSDCFSNE